MSWRHSRALHSIESHSRTATAAQFPQHHLMESVLQDRTAVKSLITVQGSCLEGKKIVTSKWLIRGVLQEWSYKCLLQEGQDHHHSSLKEILKLSECDWSLLISLIQSLKKARIQPTSCRTNHSKCPVNIPSYLNCP